MPDPVVRKPFPRSPGWNGRSVGNPTFNEDGRVVPQSPQRKVVPYEENTSGGGMKKGGMATKKMATKKMAFGGMLNNPVVKKAMEKIQASQQATKPASFRQATKPASFKSSSFAPMGAMKGGGIATKGKGVALKSGGSAKAPAKKAGLAIMIAIGKGRKK